MRNSRKAALAVPVNRGLILRALIAILKLGKQSYMGGPGGGGGWARPLLSSCRRLIGSLIPSIVPAVFSNVMCRRLTRVTPGTSLDEAVILRVFCFLFCFWFVTLS